MRMGRGEERAVDGNASEVWLGDCSVVDSGKVQVSHVRLRLQYLMPTATITIYGNCIRLQGHKTHYRRLTKKTLQIPAGHTYQMNLNLSHSAEGILSIIHRKRTHEHAISQIEVKGSNDRNQRKGSKNKKGGTPIIHQRPKKKTPIHREENTRSKRP